MSKFYMKAWSDACKSVRTIRGHNWLNVDLFHGSVHSSIRNTSIGLWYDEQGFHIKITDEEGKEIFTKTLEI